MKSWSYLEPSSAPNVEPVTITMTENEILERFYPQWVQQMMAAGHTEGITPMACIEDWIVVHWATPATKE